MAGARKEPLRSQVLNRGENMRRIRSRDTKPEITVRRTLHRMGYRYRLHRANLPGKPDLVFPSRRKVIFVHGCFWHSHACKLAHVPASNTQYWGPKLEGNRRRDAAHAAALRKLGWKCLVIWECEVRDTAKLRVRAGRFLG